MKKKWCGNIHYEGNFSRIIEAETKEEAKEILWSMFDEILPDALITDMTDCCINGFFCIKGE